MSKPTDLILSPHGRSVLRRSMPGFVQKAPRTSPRNVPQSSMAVAYSYDGRVGKPDARMYRHWSVNSEWVRGAVNVRRSQVSSAEWDIVPYDKNKQYSRRQQRDLRRLFMRPNPANDSFRSFVEPIVEDIIVLDAGCVEKVRSLDGNLREMWPVDGATIKVNANWDGSPEETRYYWYPDYKERAQFKSNDMLYIMANRRTNSPVGLSGLETLKMVIEAELYGHEYNHRQVAGAAPDGVLDLGEGMTAPDVQKYRAHFESEVSGRGAIGFIGGSKGAKWIPFRTSNRDMQFLEWQVYLVRKIALVLGLTPQDLGVTFDINRSTAETQIQISEDRGLRPLMTLLQDYFTEEVIWDPTFDGPNNNLAFRFTALNLKESTAKAVINEKALAGVPWRFINESRLEEGREPIPEMEGKLIMATPVGAVDISDVPTVRELMEMQRKPEPPPSSGGSSSKDYELLAQLISSVNAQTQRPTEIHTHIDKGAMDVKVENSMPPINVHAGTAIGATGDMFGIDGLAEQVGDVAKGLSDLREKVDNTPAPVVNVPTVDTSAFVSSVASLSKEFTEELADLRKQLTTREPGPVTRREVKRDAAGRIIEVIDHRGE